MAAKKPRRSMPVTDTDAPVIQMKPVVTKKSASGYFSRVVSNVKGPDMDIPLGACTAVVSPRNRAGKTAVLDAFRLALTGSHPIGSNAADLMGLTTDGTLPAAALTGPTAGSSFTFADGRRTGALTLLGEFQSLRAEEAEQLLPLVANRDLLTLGTAKAREGLFRRYGAAAVNSALTAPTGLSPEQVALWDKAIKGDGRGANDTVEKLAAAGTWIRSHKRTLSAAVKALEEEKARLHAQHQLGGVGAGTDDIIREVQRKLDIHRILSNTTILRQRAQVSESRLLELVEQYKASAKPMTSEEFEQAKAAIAAKYPMEQLQKSTLSGREFIATQQKNVRLFTMLVGMRKAIPQHGCLCCCDSNANSLQVTQLVAEAESSLSLAQVALQAAEHSTSQDESFYAEAQEHRNAEFMQLEGERARRVNEHERLIRELRSAKLDIEAAEAMLKEAGVADAPAETVEHLQQQLQQLQAAKQDVGRASTLAGEIRAKTVEQNDVKVVEKSLGDMLNTLVGSVREAAELAVNAWMPPGYKAALMLEDEDGKAACRWEVVGADGRPHPKGAMSGAEQAALTVAIACAWSEGQKYRFLLLDDADLAGFNADNIRGTLTMVAEAVSSGRLTQALVAWSRPNEIPDEGWSVVSL